MKAVVTGASGFIGSNLTKELTKRGYSVYTIDNKPENDSLGKYNVNKIWKLIHNPDVIFHLAAQSRVQPSFDDPRRSFDDNVKGTLSVLEWAHKQNCKVVYAGSSSKHHNPYDSPYATTKMMGEELCFMYRECFDLDVEVARFYNVYGPGEALDPTNGNVIGIWRWCIENGYNPSIVGDGEQRRDFIDVRDIVDGLIKIAESPNTHVDAWELGTGVNHSINELALMFKDKYECEFSYIEDQKGNYRETLNTNTDANERLGWQPKHKLEQYIKSL